MSGPGGRSTQAQGGKAGPWVGWWPAVRDKVAEQTGMRPTMLYIRKTPWPLWEHPGGVEATADGASESLSWKSP